MHARLQPEQLPYQGSMASRISNPESIRPLACIAEIR